MFVYRISCLSFFERALRADLLWFFEFHLMFRVQVITWFDVLFDVGQNWLNFSSVYDFQSSSGFGYQGPILSATSFKLDQPSQGSLPV
jgi:hypothetical protein